MHSHGTTQETYFSPSALTCPQQVIEEWQGSWLQALLEADHSAIPSYKT